jgi:hypothetical protein
MNFAKNFSIYVIHYSKLVDRKKYLKVILEDHGFVPEWITENDTEFFREADLISKKVLGVSSKLLGMDLGINSRSLVFTRRRARIQGWILLVRSFLTLKKNTFSTGSLPKKIDLPSYQLEIQRMHLTALSHGVKSGSNWIMILEDDAIPTNNFNSVLENIIKKYTPSMTWMNLNSGAGLIRTKSDPLPDQYGLFRIKPPSTRCTVSYLVSIDLARKILEVVRREGLPTWLPIDFVYQAALRQTKARAYWQEPVSFLQGSEEGFYASNLEGRRG